MSTWPRPTCGRWPPMPTDKCAPRPTVRCRRPRRPGRGGRSRTHARGGRRWRGSSGRSPTSWYRRTATRGWWRCACAPRRGRSSGSTAAGSRSGRRSPTPTSGRSTRPTWPRPRPRRGGPASGCACSRRSDCPSGLGSCRGRPAAARRLRAWPTLPTSWCGGWWEPEVGLSLPTGATPSRAATTWSARNGRGRPWPRSTSPRGCSLRCGGRRNWRAWCARTRLRRPVCRRGARCGWG